MNRRREPLRLGSHWHVDCRIEAELPEDSVVSLHFFANALCGTLALGAMLFVGWLGYQNFSLRQQIGSWEKRIAKTAAEVSTIQQMQREYVAAASRIDQAYGTIRPVFQVSSFIEVLGRTLPPEVTVDMVEWTDAGVSVRGYLREPATKASDLLGTYVEILRKDQRITPYFQGVRLTSIEEAKGNRELQSFSLRFTLKQLPPL
jgi:Tfp pilus assembly protein PilN